MVVRAKQAKPRRPKRVLIFKGKTLLGLVQSVRRAIIEEPKRIDMVEVVTHTEPKYVGPACGMVGCFGGWIMLKAGMPGALNLAATETILDGTQYAGDGYRINFYFNDAHGTPHYFFNAGTGDKCGQTRGQTAAHAHAVVKRIDRFIKLNYQALKARAFTPGTPAGEWRPKA